MAAQGLEDPPVNPRLEHAVQGALGERRVVLAVSGGRDSMALLHASARVARPSIACVATFDHATGIAATRAARLVAAEAKRLRLPVAVGRAASAGRSEADWRESRRAFLANVAADTKAVIVTAHTRDDQVETVVMRVLRDAGARGVAGLYAPMAGMLRPLIDVSRADVAKYATAVGASWVEDPTNADMRFLRNRVRRDLLPALRRVAPGIETDLLDLARAAAMWRDGVEAVAATMSTVRARRRVTASVAGLASFDGAALALLWPAIAARVGLAMDWRGTERAAAFTKSARPGKRIQLSGGWEIRRTRDEFELHLVVESPAADVAAPRNPKPWNAPQTRGTRSARQAATPLSL